MIHTDNSIDILMAQPTGTVQINGNIFIVEEILQSLGYAQQDRKTKEEPKSILVDLDEVTYCFCSMEEKVLQINGEAIKSQEDFVVAVEPMEQN